MTLDRDLRLILKIDNRNNQEMMEENRNVCQEGIFKNIFEEHSEVIRNFIYYKCGDIQQAEDIAQESFVKLWNNCKKVMLDNAKSFLMKIAQNTFYNEVKRSKVILKYNNSVDVSNLYDHDPEFLMEEKEFLNLLNKAISDLRPKLREVFLLSRKDKKTYKEIADIVGVTQKAVEGRMSLALLELKDKLGRSL